MEPLFFTGKLPDGNILVKTLVCIPGDKVKFKVSEGTEFVVLHSIDDDFVLLFNEQPIKAGRGRIVLFVGGMPYVLYMYTSSKMMIAEFYTYKPENKQIERLKECFEAINIPIGDHNDGGTAMVIGGRCMIRIGYPARYIAKFQNKKIPTDDLVQDGIISFDDYPCFLNFRRPWEETYPLSYMTETGSILDFKPFRPFDPIP